MNVLMPKQERFSFAACEHPTDSKKVWSSLSRTQALNDHVLESLVPEWMLESFILDEADLISLVANIEISGNKC
jgi:hypothetical protein